MKRARASIGILVSNLGTPDAPTPQALKRYLREFLSDPRVIDLPRWKRFLLLELLILPRRSPRSAEAYGKVWTPEGSPLLAISKRQCEKLEATLLEARLALLPFSESAGDWIEPHTGAAIARSTLRMGVVSVRCAPSRIWKL